MQIFTNTPSRGLPDASNTAGGDSLFDHSQHLMGVGGRSFTGEIPADIGGRLSIQGMKVFGETSQGFDAGGFLVRRTKKDNPVRDVGPPEGR